MTKPNLFGPVADTHNMAGKSNSDVAQLFRDLVAKHQVLDA